MSNLLKTAMVEPIEANRERIKSLLSGLDGLWMEAECSRYEYFPEVISNSDIDIGIVGLDSDPQRAIKLIAEIRRINSKCAVLAVSNTQDGNLILQAIRAGAREFLTAPVQFEDLTGAIERLEQSGQGASGFKQRASQVICVGGATGGVGCTSIAVNLACQLASRPTNSVALVDLDLVLGDVDVFLDVIPQYSLLDVTENVARLDKEMLHRSVVKHRSGLFILPRPLELHDAANLNPEDLRRVISLLKASFSHVVIDLSKSYSANDLAAIEQANDTLMVFQTDVPCLRNLIRLLTSLESRQEFQNKVRAVANRTGLNNHQINPKKIRESIGRDIYFQIPNDYRSVIESRNNGVPLITQAPKAMVTLAIAELAAKLTGDPSHTPQPSRVTAGRVGGAGSWLSFWPGKKESGVASQTPDVPETVEPTG